MVTDGFANRWNGVAYPAQAERRLASAHLMPGPAAEPFSGRSGRRVNNSGLKVTVDSAGAGTYTVSPGAGVIYSSAYASEGAWEFEIGNQIGPVAFPARPGPGTSRIDLIVARIYDTDVLSGGPREVKIERVSSSTVATPTAPTVPALSLLLATCTVGSAGVITVVANTQVSVAAGGILPVASVAERDKLKTDGVAYEGMYVDVAANDVLYRYDGTNWVTAGLAPVGRAVSPHWNRGATYPNATPGNVAGPWTPSAGERNGGSKAHVTASISAYAGNLNGTEIQDATHHLQAKIASGAWFDLDSKVVSQIGVAFIPLGASLSGWVSFAPDDALALRVSTDIAGGNLNVGVAGVNISASFF